MSRLCCRGEYRIWNIDLVCVWENLEFRIKNVVNLECVGEFRIYNVVYPVCVLVKNLERILEAG